MCQGRVFRRSQSPPRVTAERAAAFFSARLASRVPRHFTAGPGRGHHPRWVRCRQRGFHSTAAMSAKPDGCRRKLRSAAVHIRFPKTAGTGSTGLTTPGHRRRDAELRPENRSMSEPTARPRHAGTDFTGCCRSSTISRSLVRAAPPTPSTSTAAERARPRAERPFGHGVNCKPRTYIRTPNGGDARCRCRGRITAERLHPCQAEASRKTMLATATSSSTVGAAIARSPTRR